MEIMEILEQYVVVIVAASCFCIGYVVKNYLSTDNKHIPTIMLVLGAFFNVWYNNWQITLPILLGGMASGLAATGAHQLLKQNKSEVIEK